MHLNATKHVELRSLSVQGKFLDRPHVNAIPSVVVCMCVCVKLNATLIE